MANAECREAPPARRKGGLRGLSAVEYCLGRPPALRGISVVLREQKQTEIPAGDRNKPRAPRLKREIRLNNVNYSNRISQGARPMAVGRRNMVARGGFCPKASCGQWLSQSKPNFRVPSGTARHAGWRRFARSLIAVYCESQVCGRSLRGPLERKRETAGLRGGEAPARHGENSAKARGQSRFLFRQASKTSYGRAAIADFCAQPRGARSTIAVFQQQSGP